MNVIIKGFNKPKNCHGCPLNRSDCWCSITKGEIDRDDYLCNKPCPITETVNAIPVEKIKEILDGYDGSMPSMIICFSKIQKLVESETTDYEESNN
jgi:hypothetical protein